MSWETIVNEVREEAQRMHEAREVGLTKTRLLIQTSAKAIRHIHRKQFQEAKRLLDLGKSIAEEARTTLLPFGQLYYAGYIHDSEKELVEAHCVYAIILSQELPTHTQLGVGIMAYLNGLGEAASECRRYALDEMRTGSMEEAERILALMEMIYDDLITFDFADSMTCGLRRTCDALRPVIERTRNDMIATVQQHQLVDELRKTQRLLELQVE